MQKKFIFILFIQVFGFAQSPNELFNKSMDEIDKSNFDKAIEILDELIEKHPESENIHKIYLNRATAKSRTNDFDGAYRDYTKAYEINNTYAEAIRQRGFLNKKQKKFKSAIADYDLALKINPELTKVYINKAFLYKEIGEIDKSCENFELALEKGNIKYVGNIYKQCDTTSLAIQKFTYKLLIDKAIDSTYGHTLKNPIKVGKSPENQRAYLNLLRDVLGNKIKFKRTGVGGYYSSNNGLLGQASVDVYKLDFKNKDGSDKSLNLYLSFYDYDPPKIPVGFFSIEDFKK